MPDDILETGTGQTVGEASFLASLNATTEEDAQRQPPPAPAQPTPQPQQAPKQDTPLFETDEEVKIVVEGALDINDMFINMFCQKISGVFDEKVFKANPKYFEKLKEHTTKIATVMFKEKPNPWVVIVFLVLLCYAGPVFTAFTEKKKRKAQNNTEGISTGDMAAIMKLMEKNEPGRPTKELQDLKEAFENFRKKSLKKAA